MDDAAGGCADPSAECLRSAFACTTDGTGSVADEPVAEPGAFVQKARRTLNRPERSARRSLPPSRTALLPHPRIMTLLLVSTGLVSHLGRHTSEVQKQQLLIDEKARDDDVGHRGVHRDELDTRSALLPLRSCDPHVPSLLRHLRLCAGRNARRTGPQAGTTARNRDRRLSSPGPGRHRVVGRLSAQVQHALPVLAVQTSPARADCRPVALHDQPAVITGTFE